MIRVHGTCVALADGAVLMRGPPGAGKSDLALRLIDGGACLVADDQVELERDGELLLSRPPATIAGLLEVRGLGVLPMDYRQAVPLRLVVDLVDRDAVERMPDPASVEFLGLPVRQLSLDPRDASAAAKVRLAMRLATGTIMPLQ